MTTWRAVRIIAGFFILLSLALGIPESPVFVSKWWLAFTAFIGANLLQSGFTGWCLMETIFARLGLKRGGVRAAWQMSLFTITGSASAKLCVRSTRPHASPPHQTPTSARFSRH